MTLARDTETIESERLRLRRIAPGDIDYYARIHADPDVARYIGAGHPRSRDETERWMADIEECQARANLGQLAVIRKSDGALIGRCGLSDAAVATTAAAGMMRKGWFFSRHVPADIASELLPELGYTFGRESWGHGYATEAAGCIYRYVLQARDIRTIMSVVHRENRASLAVVKKYGVTFVDELELAGRPFDRYHWPVGRAPT